MRKAKKQTQLKTLAVAISMIAMPLISIDSYAAGLGRITVQSALGQPLRAQLEIMASKDEASSIVAQLASADAFRLAGVDYSAALTSFRFSRTIKEDGPRKYIEVTTDRPLNEPFIDMLVELNWSSGRLVREYTFLLDPPDMTQRDVSASAPIASPSPVTPLPSTVSASVAQESPAPIAAPTSKSSSGSAAAAGRPEISAKPSAAAAAITGQEREIRQGDTLGKIAREVKAEGISLDQMLVALFRENPDAFDGNMNRMRAGKILRVPDAATAGQTAPAEARKEVIAQASDWEAYRARVAARAAMAKGKDTSTPQATQGKVAPKVEEAIPAAKSGTDKLAVSRTETGKDSGKDGQKGRVGALEEDLVARDRALKDANGRIADLEKNLNDLKKLAEMKSQAGANAQKMAAAGNLTPSVPVKPVEPQKAVEAPKPVEPVKATEMVKPAEPTKPAETPIAQPSAKTDAEPVVANAPAKTEEAPKPEVAKADSPPPKPKPPKVVPPPEPEPEPDFMEENGMLVAGGGGVLALLLGYLGFSAYRRKKAAAEPVGDVAHLTEPSAAVNSVFSDTVGATVAPTTVDNVAQTSVLETVSDGTAASIDPLDEADTYLAFGKDSQAEEILLEALKATPARWAVHVKLLEIYSARRNMSQFNTLAQELRQQTAGTGSEWQRAVEMGRTLDPNNPLYMEASAASAPVSVSAEKIPVDMASTMVFSAPPVAESAPDEVESPEENAAVLDFDLGLDETPAAVPAVPAAKASAEVSALDFDMDLGSSPPADVTVAAPSAPAVAAPAGLNIDFDLDLPTPPKEEVNTLSLDTKLSLPDESTPVAVDSEEPVPALSLDVPEVTPQVVAQGVAPTEAAPDFDFDLGESPASNEVSQSVAMEEVDLPLDPGENPEAATKLELALAYEEMGDRDGARELFQEVLAEGSAAQQATAQAKLDQLG